MVRRYLVLLQLLVGAVHGLHASLPPILPPGSGATSGAGSGNSHGTLRILDFSDCDDILRAWKSSSSVNAPVSVTTQIHSLESSIIAAKVRSVRLFDRVTRDRLRSISDARARAMALSAALLKLRAPQQLTMIRRYPELASQLDIFYGFYPEGDSTLKAWWRSRLTYSGGMVHTSSQCRPAPAIVVYGVADIEDGELRVVGAWNSPLVRGNQIKPTSAPAAMKAVSLSARNDLSLNAVFEGLRDHDSGRFWLEATFGNAVS